MSDAAQALEDNQRLLTKLESIADLSAEDRDAVSGLPLRVRSIAENTDAVREGDRPTDCCLVLDGLFCRYKIVGEGKRQIMSFHTPGDLPDLQSLHLKTMDHSVGALTPSRVAYIPHASILDLTRRFPGVAAALWRDTLIDAAIFREWLVGVGRRSAYERIAHLYCEMITRYRAIGLTNDHGCEFPVTQAEIGDALGLSNVHVNRVLMELRRDGLLAIRGSTVTVLDWEGLKQAGEFDPVYLHLSRPAAAA